MRKEEGRGERRADKERGGEGGRGGRGGERRAGKSAGGSPGRAAGEDPGFHSAAVSGTGGTRP